MCDFSVSLSSWCYFMKQFNIVLALWLIALNKTINWSVDKISQRVGLLVN